ncbi:MAG: hypothetical protein RL385_3884, partial [Pseudomonadota bacterium]
VEERGTYGFEGKTHHGGVDLHPLLRGHGIEHLIGRTHDGVDVLTYTARLKAEIHNRAAPSVLNAVAGEDAAAGKRGEHVA